MLDFTSDWAEDRALLGSNPSADPEAETGDGAGALAPSLFSISGIGTKAMNPGGLGAGPQLKKVVSSTSSHAWRGS